MVRGTASTSFYFYFFPTFWTCNLHSNSFKFYSAVEVSKDQTFVHTTTSVEVFSSDQAGRLIQDVFQQAKKQIKQTKNDSNTTAVFPLCRMILYSFHNAASLL